MLILSQLVSEVDDGTLLKPKRLDARCPIPAQGRPTGPPSPLGELQAYVTILDAAYRSREAHIVSDENRLLIAVAQRLQAAQPTEQGLADLIEG